MKIPPKRYRAQLTIPDTAYRVFICLVPPTGIDDAVFERILIPLAGPDDADCAARAIRPLVDSQATLILSRVTQGDTAETAVTTGQDQSAQTTYETFVLLFDRSDVSLEWATLEGRQIAGALTDAVEVVDATVVVFIPREQDDQRRLLTGDPGSQLLRDASVPVMAVSV